MGMPNSIVAPDRSFENEQRFKTLALAYCDFGREAGVELVAFRSPELPLFVTQSEQEQQRILRSLEVCVGICQRTRAQGHSMSDSPALTWSALMQFGLRPPSDLFGHITGESVVEVHTFDGIQIFRNFNFYKYCTYSIEELYCSPWSLLYERDEAFTRSLMGAVTRIFTGEWRSTMPLNLPIHRVKETFSEAQSTVEIQMQWGAPLFEEGSSRPAATIVIEKMQFAEKTATTPNPSQLDIGLTQPALSQP